MISQRSRYASNTVSLINSTRGSVVTIMPDAPSQRAFQFTYMTLQAGDRLDLIAYRVYGDDSLWWKIADANPEILDWENAPVGSVLRIPSAS